MDAASAAVICRPVISTCSDVFICATISSAAARMACSMNSVSMNFGTSRSQILQCRFCVCSFMYIVPGALSLHSMHIAYAAFFFPSSFLLCFFSVVFVELGGSVLPVSSESLFL